MKHQKQHDKMLRDIAAYFEARFIAEPDLKEIRFSSIGELVHTLRKAYVSLWIYGNCALATKLALSCGEGQSVRWYPERYNHSEIGGWIFHCPASLMTEARTRTQQPFSPDKIRELPY